MGGKSFSVSFFVVTIWRISFVCSQARIESVKRRTIRADDFSGLAHIEVNMRVILWRPIPDALELAAADAHNRNTDFILKL
jgi:hypothetical protein